MADTSGTLRVPAADWPRARKGLCGAPTAFFVGLRRRLHRRVYFADPLALDGAAKARSPRPTPGVLLLPQDEGSLLEWLADARPSNDGSDQARAPTPRLGTGEPRRCRRAGGHRSGAVNRTPLVGTRGSGQRLQSVPAPHRAPQPRLPRSEVIDLQNGTTNVAPSSPSSARRRDAPAPPAGLPWASPRPHGRPRVRRPKDRTTGHVPRLGEMSSAAFRCEPGIRLSRRGYETGTLDRDAGLLQVHRPGGHARDEASRPFVVPNQPVVGVTFHDLGYATPGRGLPAPTSACGVRGRARPTVGSPFGEATQHPRRSRAACAIGLYCGSDPRRHHSPGTSPVDGRRVGDQRLIHPAPGQPRCAGQGLALHPSGPLAALASGREDA